MKPPPPFPPPAHPARSGSRSTALLLWLLCLVSAGAGVVGAGYALAANTPANRAATPLADVAVATGTAAAVGGVAFALLFGVLAARTGGRSDW